jgi:hypothetical protein
MVMALLAQEGRQWARKLQMMRSAVTSFTTIWPLSQVLVGAAQTSVAAESGIARTTLSRLVRRTKQLGQIVCVPLGSYAQKATMHPAFLECIRRLYILPTCLSMAAIHEHTEMRQLVVRLTVETGQTVKLPSYEQVRFSITRRPEPTTNSTEAGEANLESEQSRQPWQHQYRRLQSSLAGMNSTCACAIYVWARRHLLSV